MSEGKKLILVVLFSILLASALVACIRKPQEQGPDANAIMFEELKTEILNLNTEISGLNTEITGLREETTDLKTNVEDMTGKVTELQEQLESTTGELKKLKNAFKNLGVDF